MVFADEKRHVPVHPVVAAQSGLAVQPGIATVIRFVNVTVLNFYPKRVGRGG